MKKADLVTSIFLVPIDYLMLVLAGLTSYSLRFHEVVTQIRPVFFDYPISDFMPLLFVMSAIGVLIFALSGSYKVQGKTTAGQIFSKVFFGVSTIILFVIVMIFLQRELFSSRFIIILAWVIALIYVFAGRVFVYRLKSSFLARGIGAHKLAIIGNTTASETLVRYFARNPKHGFKVVTQYTDLTPDVLSEIKLKRETKSIDEIIDVRKHHDSRQLLELINYCHEVGIVFRYLATPFQTKISNFEMDDVAGYPIIQVNRTPLDGWRRVYKRLVDILVSVVMLTVLMPIFVIIAAIIRVDSDGPILVKLRRVGRNGKTFFVYKFRSMVKNAHELKSTVMDLNERSDGPLFKSEHDPRITKVGRVLRKTSIDEFPQLLNVIKGEMSLVGPRPHEPEEVAQYEKEFRPLLGSKPGITGMSQVSGRSKLPFREEMTLDTYYIEHWSMGLDIRILLKTLVIIFKFKEAG